MDEVMRRTLLLFMVLLLPTTVGGVVLCARQRGDVTFSTAVKIREVCSGRETQLDPIALGLKGPQGEPGVCECPGVTTTTTTGAASTTTSSFTTTTTASATTSTTLAD